MFYEYALEPSVLSTWERARFFLDAFGPWKGRFLAEYPRRWKKMVFESLVCPDVEKKRITERLAQLDKRVFSGRANASYDGARPWIENAEAEHARLAFRAIVAVDTSDKSYLLDGATVDDLDPRWRIEAGQLVPREPAKVVSALLLLLNASRRIVMIDPYFYAEQDDKVQPLVAFCRAVLDRAAVEVHCSDEPKGYEACMRVAARALPNILPNGMKVTLHCWRELSGGPRLHNRYLLTEVGGVKFGDSIEMGSKGQEDHLSILDETSRIALWEQYLGDPPAFYPACPPRDFVGRV